MWNCGSTRLWYQNKSEENDGGMDYLLGYIRQTAESWRGWAEYYYDREFDNAVVEKIFAGGAVTSEDILKLNPERITDEALEEISELS